MTLKPYVFSVLLSVFMLQGCAGGLIVAAGTAVAVSNDERSISQLIKDDDLSESAIDAVIASKAYNDNIRINIIANNSYLLLIGQVDTQANSNIIENELNNVPGVVGVYNQLRVNQPIGVVQKTKDSWLTAKVKSQLTSHDKINPLKIKVVTENGEVFLIGQVTQEMSDFATEVTSNVEGVQQVIRVFEITPTKTTGS